VKRRVFYSFCYKDDVFRVNQVRNIGEIEDNKLVYKNEFEQIKRSGDAAIKRWIDSQLNDRTCTIVLAGRNTATRPWVQYEIAESWNRGMGVLVVYIHNLKDNNGRVCDKGPNPLDFVSFDDGFSLSYKLTLNSTINLICKDPGIYAYDNIKTNLSQWVETAIKIRNNY